MAVTDKKLIHNSEAMGEETVQRLAEIFGALGDPTRLRILHALFLEETCVCDLSAAIGISESLASHQLRRLHLLRLVKSRRAGKHIYYSLADEHIKRLYADGLEHVLEKRYGSG